MTLKIKCECESIEYNNDASNCYESIVLKVKDLIDEICSDLNDCTIKIITDYPKSCTPLSVGDETVVWISSGVFDKSVQVNALSQSKKGSDVVLTKFNSSCLRVEAELPKLDFIKYGEEYYFGFEHK